MLVQLSGLVRVVPATESGIVIDHKVAPGVLFMGTVVSQPPSTTKSGLPHV